MIIFLRGVLGKVKLKSTVYLAYMGIINNIFCKANQVNFDTRHKRRGLPFLGNKHKNDVTKVASIGANRPKSAFCNSPIIYLVLLSLPFVTLAKKPQRLCKVKSWAVYKEAKGKKKNQFYIVSKPYRTDGKVMRAFKPYVMVSRDPLTKNPIVSVYTATPHKDWSEIKVCPGKKCFTLHAKNNRAWTASTQDDKRIIQAMKNWKYLQVMYTYKGKPIKDRYSLMGFSKSYRKVFKH